MVGDGINIAEALRRFTSFALQMIQTHIEGQPTREAAREAADTCAWNTPLYPPLMRKLAKLPEFASPVYYTNATPKNEAEKRADAYICGYWRGLQEAVYQYALLRWEEEEEAEQERKRKAAKRRKRK